MEERSNYKLIIDYPEERRKTMMAKENITPMLSTFQLLNSKDLKRKLPRINEQWNIIINNTFGIVNKPYIFSELYTQ